MIGGAEARSFRIGSAQAFRSASNIAAAGPRGRRFYQLAWHHKKVPIRRFGAPPQCNNQVTTYRVPQLWIDTSNVRSFRMLAASTSVRLKFAATSDALNPAFFRSARLRPAAFRVVSLKPASFSRLG